MLSMRYLAFLSSNSLVNDFPMFVDDVQIDPGRHFVALLMVRLRGCSVWHFVRRTQLTASWHTIHQRFIGVRQHPVERAAGTSTDCVFI